MCMCDFPFYFFYSLLFLLFVPFLFVSFFCSLRCCGASTSCAAPPPGNTIFRAERAGSSSITSPICANSAHTRTALARRILVGQIFEFRAGCPTQRPARYRRNAETGRLHRSGPAGHEALRIPPIRWAGWLVRLDVFLSATKGHRPYIRGHVTDKRCPTHVHCSARAPALQERWVATIVALRGTADRGASVERYDLCTYVCRERTLCAPGLRMSRWLHGGVSIYLSTYLCRHADGSGDAVDRGSLHVRAAASPALRIYARRSAGIPAWQGSHDARFGDPAAARCSRFISDAGGGGGGHLRGECGARSLARPLGRQPLSSRLCAAHCCIPARQTSVLCCGWGAVPSRAIRGQFRSETHCFVRHPGAYVPGYCRRLLCRRRGDMRFLHLFRSDRQAAFRIPFGPPTTTLNRTDPDRAP